jgi:2'-5' RNA ligase
MTMIRAFIAVELSADIQHHLQQVTNQLKLELAGIPIRWVVVQNIHLTLMFLGDVSAANLPLVKDNIEAEAINHHPFEISIGRLGVFPNLQRPRVIWVGVEAPGELTAIQSSIEHRMTRLGYLREERAFSPHLTLGRVSRNIIPSELHSMSQIIQSTQVGFLGAAIIDQIHLFRSDLRPEGAVYTKIQSCFLSKKP